MAKRGQHFLPYRGDAIRIISVRARNEEDKLYRTP